MISEPTASDWRYWPDKLMCVYEEEPPNLNSHTEYKDMSNRRSNIRTLINKTVFITQKLIMLYNRAPVATDSVSADSVSAVYRGLPKNWKIKEINGS
jgi:hypothetical protein